MDTPTIYFYSGDLKTCTFTSFRKRRTSSSSDWQLVPGESKVEARRASTTTAQTKLFNRWLRCYRSPDRLLLAQPSFGSISFTCTHKEDDKWRTIQLYSQRFRTPATDTPEMIGATYIQRLNGGKPLTIEDHDRFAAVNVDILHP